MAASGPVGRGPVILGIGGAVLGNITAGFRLDARIAVISWKRKDAPSIDDPNPVIVRAA